MSPQALTAPASRTAPIYTELRLFTRAAAAVESARESLGRTKAAPVGTRELMLRSLRKQVGIATRAIGELPCMTPGLRRRRTELERQLDSITREAAELASRASDAPRNNVVRVDFTRHAAAQSQQ